MPGPGPRDAGYLDPGYRDQGYRDPGYRDPLGRHDGYESARNPRRFRDDPTFASGNSPDDAIIRSGLLASPGLRWVGAWSLKRAAWILLGAALLGMVATIVIGRDPGFLIGLLIIVGSVVAAFGVQRRAVPKLLPLPALSYLVTTTIAGMVHERANLNDSKEYVTSFLTWIGSAFFAVVGATVLVAVISLARWLLSKRVVSGNLPASGGPPAGRNPYGGARGGDPYGGDPYGGDPYGGDPRRGARGDQRSWGDRGTPDSRGRRDPWGEPGSREDTRGYRPPHGGDRNRRADKDARDPWAAVDGQDDRDAGRRADRGRGQRGDRDLWGEDLGDRADRGPWGGNPSGNGHGNHGQWDGGRRGDAQSPPRFGDPRDSQDFRNSRDSRDARDPRDSRDSGDNRRPRPGAGPRDLW